MQEVGDLVRYEILEHTALKAMLFGMDCLVQEVHIPRDVLVSEFDGRFGIFSDSSGS